MGVYRPLVLPYEPPTGQALKYQKNVEGFDKTLRDFLNESVRLDQINLKKKKIMYRKNV